MILYKKEKRNYELSVIIKYWFYFCNFNILIFVLIVSICLDEKLRTELINKMGLDRLLEQHKRIYYIIYYIIVKYFKDIYS